MPGSTTDDSDLKPPLRPLLLLVGFSWPMSRVVEPSRSTSVLPLKSPALRYSFAKGVAACAAPTISTWTSQKMADGPLWATSTDRISLGHSLHIDESQ